MWHYIKKCVGIYTWNVLQWVNRHVLHTHPLIEECARCRDCGRNVHDFYVPDALWRIVIEKEGVWCFDCFCNRAAEKHIRIEWRSDFVVKWNVSG